MKVKRFVGDTAQEVMQKVKAELGREAIIISTRKVRKSGILGFFNKPVVEVVATVDSEYGQPAKKPAATSLNLSVDDSSGIFQNSRKESTTNTNPTYNFKAELRNRLGQETLDSGNISDEKIREALDAINASHSNMNKSSDGTINSVSSIANNRTQNNDRHNNENKITTEYPSYDTKKEIDELKTMVSRIFDAVKDNYEEKNFSEIVKKYLRILESNEVEKTILNEIKEKIIDQLDQEKQNSETIVRNTIFKILSTYFKEPQPFAFNGNKKVLIFIGPTGVGKTTTVAKLAANMVLTEKKKVGLITSDTYRIAAVEQLKTYSEIIGVPLSIIYSPSEIQKAINAYSDKEIIMVDTAGRSHKDKYQLVELKSLLSSGRNYETYLVISATTKFSDCIDIIKSYNFLEDYKLIFTKLDETCSIGLLLNIAYVTGKPVSYVTTGQSVPDDIEIADNGKIINCLLGERLYERSS